MNDGGRRAPRAHVAYIMSRFPLLTETFILREMLELERQGASLLVLPLLRARQAVRHAEVERLRAEVHYTPFVSPAIVAANLHFLLRSPARYLRLLWAVLRGNFGSANLFFGALGVFPKSVYFARLVRARGVGHVHAHFATHPALSALVVSELSGASFSFTAHAHDIFLHELMLAEKVRRARFVVSISEFNKRYILERARGVAADKIEVVRCGIEPERYDARRAPKGPDGGPLTALCVAALQPYKGIKHLVRACARVARRVPDFRCLVVGEGADRAELEALIGELNLRDTFRLLGARPQHEVAELLGRADLFVLPSVVAPSGQMEGVPVALMEAMATRLPVVSTRISGIPELVEDGVSGLLVEPADDEALADALVRLCEDAALRARLGASGREKVLAEFTLEENVARLRALFDEAARAAGRVEDDVRAAGGNGNGRVGASAPLDEALVEWAREKLDGAGLDDVRVSRLGGGRDSEVFELAAGEGGARPPLVLKLHRPNWARAGEEVERGRAHADNEFRALSMLWGEFSRRSERLAVPRPVGLKPERAALLIEKSPGVRLERAARWARLRPGAFGRLRGWFGACGEWLATFHGVTARAGDPRPVYERIEREFGEEVEACRALGLGDALASALARRFEEGKGAAFDPRARVVGRHCDFAPYNVLVTEGRVTVIDFEGLRDGVAYDDLCYFLGMVEATPAYHLSRRMRGALRAEFLRGYERQGSLERAPLDFYTLAAMVKIMAHSPVLRRAGTWRDSLKRRQRLRFYRGWFARVLARV
ncbi:MAG TPA: glycosyltransferase [Pyrinomonadaceae bacterium]|jgi:glycosyltransferase involved in cell wall biosynthesis/Ser/Thr protein kinase RdoA (MazF antagonist)